MYFSLLQYCTRVIIPMTIDLKIYIEPTSMVAMATVTVNT